MANYQRSSVKGAGAFRRVLKQLPDSADKRMLAMLNQAGPVLAEKMRASLPSRTGAVRAGISWKVTPVSKTLKVGLLGTPKGRAKLFYAYILDVGRKAGMYKVRRGPQAGSTKRMPAFPGLHVVSAGLKQFRQQFLPDYRQLMDDILLDAARGGGSDDD